MCLEMVLAKIVKTIVNFSSFWLKKRFYRDLGGIYVFFYFFYDFGTVPPQNRKEIVKKIVDFSSFWLKTRFCGPWLHLRFLRIFQFCFKIRFCGGKRLLGKGNSTKID
jgi:hypothetical protein